MMTTYYLQIRKGDIFLHHTIILHEIGQDPMYKIWHASKNAMFIYLHSDGGSIVCSENSYPIQSGTLCFIGSGKYHYTMPDEPQSYDRSKLFVSSEVIVKSMQLLSHTNRLRIFTEDAFVYAPIPKDKQAHIEALFSALYASEQNELHSELLLYACCLELFFFLDQYALDTTHTTTNTIHQAIEYIHHHICEDISIDDICAAIPMSKYHFCRKFKQVTEMTVMDYILQTRLVLAQNMLVKEKCSVTEISEQCGFSSVSYFCRIFKQRNHMTPLAYRQLHRK